MVRVGIIGGAGYTGGEAIRILLNHPDVELAFVHSNSNGGNRLSDVHIDLLGETDMRFTDQLRTDVDALMLCVGHGDARKFLEATPIPDSVRIIDLSQDFRLQATASIGNRQFVYGLPELNREKIRAARNIANPGCFATCLPTGHTAVGCGRAADGRRAGNGRHRFDRRRAETGPDFAFQPAGQQPVGL